MLVKKVSELQKRYGKFVCMAQRKELGLHNQTDSSSKPQLGGHVSWGVKSQHFHLQKENNNVHTLQIFCLSKGDNHYSIMYTKYPAQSLVCTRHSSSVIACLLPLVRQLLLQALPLVLLFPQVQMWKCNLLSSLAIKYPQQQHTEQEIQESCKGFETSRTFSKSCMVP